MGMRIGGAFPFNFSGAFPVSLAGGQICYPPAGNYLMTLGAQTCLQWWDPVNFSWRNVAQPNAETFQISVDGFNWRLVNASGIVAAASITNAGSGGTNGIGPTATGSTVTFAAGGTGPGGTATGYVIVGGAVGTAGGSATVTQGGSGFQVPPLILIDPPPPGGIQATATATITAGGALNAVTMVNPGAGYTSVPNFYVVPQFLNYPGAPTNPPVGSGTQPNFPAGTIANNPPAPWMMGLSPAFPTTAGALVTGPALAGSGTLTGVVMTNYGYGYTTVPAITFANTTGALAGGVAATSIMSWGVTALTGGSGVAYTIGNVW